MKHTKETKDKISKTMKDRGIKPTVLPSGEQCRKNLGDFLMKSGMSPWNKGRKTGKPSWNSGKAHTAITGDKNPNWSGGKANCISCNKKLTHYRKNTKCISCHKKENRGEKHPLWKGGVGSPFRKTQEYKNWRMTVFKRDWFTCQMPECGYKGKDIQAHHIYKASEYKERVYEPTNGITLCIDCHNETRCKENDFVELFNNILTT